MSDRKPGEQANLLFYHATSGLADSAFTKKVYVNGAATSTSLAIAEVEPNFYRIRFTPAQAGEWYVCTYQTASPATKYEWNIVVRGTPELQTLKSIATRIERNIRGI